MAPPLPRRQAQLGVLLSLCCVLLLRFAPYRCRFDSVLSVAAAFDDRPSLLRASVLLVAMLIAVQRQRQRQQRQPQWQRLRCDHCYHCCLSLFVATPSVFEFRQLASVGAAFDL